MHCPVCAKDVKTDAGLRKHAMGSRDYGGHAHTLEQADDLVQQARSGASVEVLATLALDDVASPDLAVACALLHDTVEDTETTTDEIAEAFGVAVADGVRALSKDKAVPKADQMADSLRRIQEQPREIWIVKLADRAVNMEPAPTTWSMEKRRNYQRQATTIVEQLGSASPSLAARLREKIARYETCITPP